MSFVTLSKTAITKRLNETVVSEIVANGNNMYIVIGGQSDKSTAICTLPDGKIYQLSHAAYDRLKVLGTLNKPVTLEMINDQSFLAAVREECRVKSEREVLRQSLSKLSSDELIEMVLNASGKK